MLQIAKPFQVEYSGEFDQWNSVGLCMALSMNSVGIPGAFRGDARFSGKFGVWGGFGRFGASKGFRKNLPRPAPFTPLSTHVFTHQSRPMRTVFCHQSLTQGQRIAFCLLGGLLQTRLPLPNEFISKSPLALLFEHSSITTSSTAKLSLVLSFL